MPAVSLARLKTQIAGLAWKFANPDEFRRAVSELFDLYADRAYRPGEVIQAERKALAYHSPPLVLRQLELELVRHCRENPGAALSAADALWKDDYLEPRLVAAYLVGQVPLDPIEPVMDRMTAWCQPKVDRQALDGLLDRGCERLRREQPQHWLDLLQDWINQGRPIYDSMVLRALLPAIRDRQFKNLPPTYKVLGSLLQSPTAAVQGNLVDVIKALARRSPTETAFFLRQAVSLNPNPVILRLVRRALPAFPENVQEGLRSVLKNA